MKKGQIILGVASAIIAVGSGLAFKASHKFTRHAVYGKTSASSSVCVACGTLRTGSGTNAVNCKTTAAVKTAFITDVAGTAHLYTQKTNGGTCAGNKVSAVSKTE
jgi:hypothetical protein